MIDAAREVARKALWTPRRVGLAWIGGLAYTSRLADVIWLASREGLVLGGGGLTGVVLGDRRDVRAPVRIRRRVLAGRDSGHGRAMRIGRRTRVGRDGLLGLDILVGGIASGLVGPCWSTYALRPRREGLA